jgi:hypothetical protein
MKFAIQMQIFIELIKPTTDKIQISNFHR